MIANIASQVYYFFVATRIMIIALLALFVNIQPALGQERLIDLDQFCQSQHGSDAFLTTRVEDNAFICAVRSDGGLGLHHFELDIGAACLVEFGISNFSRDGNEVKCTSVKKEDEGIKVDLFAYCREQFGTDAVQTMNLVTGEPMCTIRKVGGLLQEHHYIDFAELCGVAGGVVEEGFLKCGIDIAGSSNSPADNLGNDNLPGDSRHETGSDAVDESPSLPDPASNSPSIWVPSDGDVLRLGALSQMGAIGPVSYEAATVRVERVGNRIRMYSLGHPDYAPTELPDYFVPNDALFAESAKRDEWRMYMFVTLAEPGRLVFEGQIDGRIISGKESFILVAYRLLSAPDMPSCQREFVTTYLSDFSAWPQVTGTIDTDRIVLTVRPATVGLKYNDDYSAQIDCEPNYVYGQGQLELIPEPTVIGVDFVDIEDVSRYLNELLPGQAFRLRVLVDRDAEGQIVSASVSGGKQSLSVETRCGGPVAGSPRVCLSDPITVLR